MKRLLKIIKGVVRGLKENLVPIMVFFIVVFALIPYCRDVRGYYAIGGEYIFAGFVAYGTSRLIKTKERKYEKN